MYLYSLNLLNFMGYGLDFMIDEGAKMLCLRVYIEKLLEMLRLNVFVIASICENEILNIYLASFMFDKFLKL